LLLTLLVAVGVVTPAHSHDERLSPTDACAVCRVARDVPAVVPSALPLVPVFLDVPAPEPARPSVRGACPARARARSPPPVV